MEKVPYRIVYQIVKIQCAKVRYFGGRKDGDISVHRGDSALSILLLVVDKSTNMGGFMRQIRERPVKSDGISVSLVEAHSVFLSLLSLHYFLAASFLLLASLPLRPVSQLQVSFPLPPAPSLLILYLSLYIHMYVCMYSTFF